MTTPAQKNQPLSRQLLFSHLSIALIGVLMLGIALVATHDLRSRMVSLANGSGPLTHAAFQLRVGIQSSLTSLHGWVATGEQQFLDSWHSAWRKDIQAAREQLKHDKPVSFGQRIPPPWHELQTLLDDLQKSQSKVQNIAHTPSNEPARIAYLQAVEPQIMALRSALMAFSPEEKQLAVTAERKTWSEQRADIQDTLASAHLALRKLLGADGLPEEPRFQEKLKQLQASIEAMGTHPALTPTQLQQLQHIREALQVFTDTSQQLIQLRQSPRWNIALHILSTETKPLSDQLIARIDALAAHAKARMDQEILAAQSASTLAAWSLGFMIVVMLVMAYVLSQKYSRAISLPLTTLAEATRQMAAGQTHTDLPISDNHEISVLTRSFNAMRASMQRGQDILRQTNVLLEQRVTERAAELAEVNNTLFQEIGVRSQTEKALRESEARLIAMTKAIPDLVFVVDEDGCHREILASRRDIVAIGPLRGKLLSEIYPPDKAAYFLEIIQRALETQRIQIAEYELKTASGLRWFESRTAPLDVKFGNKAAAIVVAHDITKRKQAETQLRQAQKMQAIGQLTGGIAHDFNNLLAVIMGNLELLHEQLTAQPRLHELAQQALRAVDRGANLTRRLLAFARRQPLLAQPTDLNRLVLSMLDLMRRTLGATIQIDTVLAGNLQLTLVDPDQLESALLNLVINARDAMPQGGKLTLETSHVLISKDDYAVAESELQPGPYVMLTVSDTGVGMIPESLERAFEPFFTTKESGKGSGLGLSMVYGLVKQSDGHITIDSEPGRGTTVRLYLPQIETSAQTTPENPTTVRPIQQGQGETILVVEDDPGVRQFAVNAVRDLGYEPVSAENAAAALQRLDTTPNIALLFTDIVMPGEMDGVKLAAEIQRRHPGLPVLFTSGYTEHVLIGGGHPTEGVEVLAKPYRKAELGKKLQLLLGHREQN